MSKAVVVIRRLAATLGPAAMALLVIATVAMCLANTRQLFFVGVGSLLAILMFWRLPGEVKTLVVVGTIILILLFLSACEPQGYVWTVGFRTSITLVRDNSEWDVRDEVTVPGETIRQIVE